MKDFKTYDEQIDLLKTRGLIIENEEYAKEKLKEDNYYNIINGYKELFITPGTTDNFIAGSTFEERFGNDNYLKMSNFETLRGSGCTVNRYQERVTQIQNLLANLQQDIARAISKRPYINHYILNYGFVPLWVLVNTITLGRLSQFYSLMNQPVRVKVAQHWNVKEEDLDQYIKALANYRNLCAHDERLYNATNNQDIPDTIYHVRLNIPQINSRYANGKNDLFSLVIVLKILLPHEDFNNMCNKINGRMESLRKKIKHINCDDIFKKMGFPSNWIQIKTA